MKYCSFCGAEIFDKAVQCVKCGSSLEKAHDKSRKEADIFLILFALIFCSTVVIQFIISKITTNWFGSVIDNFSRLLTISRNLSFILPAFAIHNKVLKIIGIIILGAPILYWTFPLFSLFIK
jgi:predicted nucleic acid-binding Zn ribbon protein